MSQPEETREELRSPISASSRNSSTQSTPTSQNSSSVRNQRPPTWTKDYYMSEEMFNEDEAGFAMYSVMDDPITYEEACREEKWE